VLGEPWPSQSQLTAAEVREQFTDVEYGEAPTLAAFGMNAATVMRQLIKRAKRLDHRVRG
jgi:hypothetical protein